MRAVKDEMSQLFSKIARFMVTEGPVMAQDCLENSPQSKTKNKYKVSKHYSL